MKMSKSLFIAMAVAVAAWAQDEVAPQIPSPVPEAEPVAPAKTVRAKKVRPPHEHRGFFFSMGMTFPHFCSHCKMRMLPKVQQEGSGAA